MLHSHHHLLTEPHVIACLVAAAAAYTMVGHGGASAYIAIMVLCGVDPEVVRPTALVLNIVVAGYASWRYVRAGHVRWRTLWPFLIGAVPLAYAGGTIVLPDAALAAVVGVVLLVAAARLLWPSPVLPDDRPWADPPVPAAVAWGAGIGFLSGLTGVGGGIFLSPLLILAGWSPARAASGTAALFILANSVAGLAGNVQTLRGLPPELPVLAGAVLAGAAVGTSLGMRLPSPVILRVLGAVLAVAAVKLLGGFDWHL